jgi:hypothetical protein
MKNILTLFAFTIAMTISSCKKDNEIAKPEFIDIEFKLYDLRTSGDVTIYDVTPSSSLVLKKDFTWVIDLGGAKSNGTYSWTPTSNQQADIKFTIVSWTDYTSNQILSDKLKLALQQVNHCGYSLQDPSFANFLSNSYGDYFASIRTNKK